MLTEANKALSDWLREASGDASVSQAPPASPEADGQVNCYLFDVSQSPALKNGADDGVDFDLFYLVTADDHALLDKLYVAAVNDADIEIDNTARDPAFWLALGAAPRPALVLKRRGRVARERPRAPLVRGAMTVRYQPVSALYGRVLGPDDIPLQRVEVSLPQAGLTTKTARDGRFNFRSVPSESGAQSLVIKVKGRDIAVPDIEVGRQKAPLIIHVTAKEMEDARI